MSEIPAEIAEVSLLLFGLILLVCQLVAYATGFRIGRRIKPTSETPETAGVIVGGILALLAFVLALTLSFASARFTELRSGTVAEANAIGTAWLRATAIDDPRAAGIARLLERYIGVREDFVRAGRDIATLDRLDDQTAALQAEIWAQLTEIVRDRPDPVTTALMTSLNEVFDAATAERFAFHIRVPPQISWLLVSMSLLAMAMLGYQQALRSKRHGIMTALLAVTWTVVIVDVLDLASARLGNFRIGTEPYEWTRQGFAPPGQPPAGNSD